MPRLHFEILVDHIRRKILRRGEQRRNALLFQGGHDEPLFEDELLGNDVAVVLFRALRRTGDVGLQFGIFEENHQQTVAMIELLQVSQLAVHTAHGREIGIKHQQAALAHVFVQMYAKRREVGFAEIRLLAVQALQQALHVPRLFGSGDKRIEALAEGCQPGFVFLLHRHERKHQRSIDGIIEQRHAPESLLHHPSLIYHIVYLLRTFVLIDVHHQLVAARAGFPVDSAVVISLHIIFYLFELRVMPHPAYALDAKLRKIVAYSQKFVVMKHPVRRIYFDVLRLCTGVAAGKKTYPRGGEHPDSPERIDSPSRRAKGIDKRFFSLAAERDAHLPVALLKDERDFVDYLQPHRMSVTAFQADADFILIAVGETVGAAAESPYAPHTVKQEAVRRHKQDEQEQRPPPGNEQRSERIAATQQEDNEREGYIETTGKVQGATI